MRMAAAHAVEHAHHPPASATSHEASEQSPTATPGLAGGALLHMRVLQEHALVRLEPLPIDAALMMIADQDIPLGHRLVVASGFHRAAVHDAGPLTPSAERPSTSVEGAPA